MSSDTKVNTEDVSKDGKEVGEGKSKCNCKWATSMFWVLLLVFIVFLVVQLIACNEVGSIWSAVPTCSGEAWYASMIGSC